MKNKLIYPLAVTVLLAGAACRGDGDASASQKQYESVQEGSAAGVTSTIHGPGEVVPPMTGTNADTTTAFTLNPNAVSTSQPGTVAGTFPPPQYPSSVPSGTYMPPMTRTPVTRTSPAPVTRTPPATSTWPSSQPTPQQPPEQPPPTDTTEPAPPPTDTTATQQQPPPATQTAPPPPPAEKPKEEKKEKPPEQEDEGEQTDTAPPPPPPGR